MRVSFLIVLIILLSSCNKDNDRQFSNWELLNSNTTQSIIDIDFSDDNNGVALIPIGKILITKNGGDNWEERSIVSGENFISCYTLNQNYIYVGRKRFFKSSNGGHDFYEFGQGQIDFSSAIFGIHFFNSSAGVILKGGSIYKTNDGGDLWEEKYSQATWANILEYAKENTLYATGGRTYDSINEAVMHKSTDNGETWSEINLPYEIQNSEIRAIDFLTDNIGFISTFNNKIFKTLDGANSWNLINGFSSPIHDLTFLDEQRGYLTSNNYIYKTSNGGSKWDIDFHANTELFSIEKTQNIVYVTGRDGVILKLE